MRPHAATLTLVAENTGEMDAANGNPATPTVADAPTRRRRRPLRTAALVLVVLFAGYCLTVRFVAPVYTIPSEAMEPTLHGCGGCVDDHVVVNKLAYLSSAPQPGDVIVFKGPPAWSVGAVGENDLVKRVIAVGGQTVQCRNNTGLTVDGKKLTEPYLDPATLNADPAVYPCLGPEFGPVTVPQSRLWLMGDNRTHSADSRAHCTSTPADAINGLLCTGDPMAGTVPVGNIIGTARFIVWPPSRWGDVGSVNPQSGK